MRRPSTITAAFVLSLSVASVARGAGFQVSETSVAGLGLAFAGAGIVGDGAADLFHNPAGLMLGDGRELEVALHVIQPSAKFDDRGSTMTTPAMTDSLTGGESDGGIDAVAPNFFFAADGETKKIRHGVGVTSPFGLTTKYDAGWVGRYHAIKTELITVELNPVVAYQLNESVAVGAGVTVIHADAEISQAVFLGATDGRATVKGDDTALGFTVGVTAGDDDARIGLGYRSRTKLKIKGDLKIPAVGMQTGARADLTLPATIYLSGYKKLDDRLDLFGTWRWTDWSEFDELRIEIGAGRPPQVTPQNWGDSSTYSVGVRYRFNDRWTWRAGYAKDFSPIKKRAHRTARIPDSDRDWFALGGSYRATDKMRVDFAYAHLFTDAAPVNETVDLDRANPGTVTANLNGNFTGFTADIIAVQLHFELGG